MRWEMEVEEIEATMEKIWDLHDKVSDAIHSISRAHFFKSIRTIGRASPGKKRQGDFRGEDGRSRDGGFVFVKGFAVEEEEEDGAAIAEARSLHSIRTALENLEDQLEFFHTVQSQQRAQRDAAIARLEQSRIILAMRLADHHGKKYKVIEEALAFVGGVHDKGRFVAPEDLFEKTKSSPADDAEVHEAERSNFLKQMLRSGISFAKKSLELGKSGGVLGNAALFAISMFAAFQLHQVALKGGFLLGAPSEQEQISSRSAAGNYNSRLEKPIQSNEVKHLNVFSARG